MMQEFPIRGGLIPRPTIVIAGIKVAGIILLLVGLWKSNVIASDGTGMMNNPESSVPLLVQSATSSRLALRDLQGKI